MQSHSGKEGEVGAVDLRWKETEKSLGERVGDPSNGAQLLGRGAQLPELLGQRRRLVFPATHSHTGGGRKSLKTRSEQGSTSAWQKKKNC